MTDKQIIIDGVQFNKWGDFLIDYELNGIYKTISSSDKCYKILKSLIEQLKAKEQECKNNKIAYQMELDIFNQECLNLLEELKAKEQECEELKDKLNCCFCNPYVELNDIEKQRKCVEVTECFRRQLDQLKQTLAEIKEVLQLYNNTTIGTDKGNGIFEFEVLNDNVLGGKLIYYYDTNPAKKALQKISEVEDEHNG